eukprot:3936132-Rhodomonas_salina.1
MFISMRSLSRMPHMQAGRRRCTTLPIQRAMAHCCAASHSFCVPARVHPVHDITSHSRRAATVVARDTELRVSMAVTRERSSGVARRTSVSHAPVCATALVLNTAKTVLSPSGSAKSTMLFCAMTSRRREETPSRDSVNMFPTVEWMLDSSVAVRYTRFAELASATQPSTRSASRSRSHMRSSAAGAVGTSTALLCAKASTRSASATSVKRLAEASHGSGPSTPASGVSASRSTSQRTHAVCNEDAASGCRTRTDPCATTVAAVQSPRVEGLVTEHLQQTPDLAEPGAHEDAVRAQREQGVSGTRRAVVQEKDLQQALRPNLAARDLPSPNLAQPRAAGVRGAVDRDREALEFVDTRHGKAATLHRVTHLLTALVFNHAEHVKGLERATREDVGLSHEGCLEKHLRLVHAPGRRHAVASGLEGGEQVRAALATRQRPTAHAEVVQRVRHERHHVRVRIQVRAAAPATTEDGDKVVDAGLQLLRDVVGYRKQRVRQMEQAIIHDLRHARTHTSELRRAPPDDTRDDGP